MIRLPQGPGRAFLITLLFLFGACRTPAPSEAGKADDPLYRKLDPMARELAEDALQTGLESLPSNSTRHWQLDGTPVSGSVTPLRTFRIKTGHFCREFREVIARNGDAVARIEIACRNATGGWTVVPPRDQSG